MKYNLAKHHKHEVFVHFKIHQVGRIEPPLGQFWPAGRIFDSLHLLIPILVLMPQYF